MSTISVRLPDSLHNSVREMAEKENVSINHFITLALAEKLSALMTEENLQARAGRADRERFLRALDRVPDAAPEDRDSL